MATFVEIVSDEDLIARAARAYCRRVGPGVQWPGAGSEVDDDDVVTLRNCNGVLARYQYDRKADRLKRVEG